MVQVSRNLAIPAGLLLASLAPPATAIPAPQHLLPDGTPLLLEAGGQFTVSAADQAVDLAAGGSRFFMSMHSSAPGSGGETVVLAAEAGSGAVVWTAQLPEPTPSGSGKIPLAASASGDRVYVLRDHGTLQYQTSLTALDGATGAELWSVGAAFQDVGTPQALDLGAQGSRVLSVTEQSTTVGVHQLTVDCRAASDGALLWQDVFAVTAGVLDSYGVEITAELSESGSHAVVSWSSGSPLAANDPSYSMRVYDGATGAGYSLFAPVKGPGPMALASSGQRVATVDQLGRLVT